MGSGKTTVGELLAGITGATFLDLDRLIEQETGMLIPELFEKLGELEFRAIEGQVLRSTEYPGQAVIATGGGALIPLESLEIARELGPVVWINPTFDTIAKRIGIEGKKDRPLFGNVLEAKNLYRSRLPAYRRADLQLNVDSEESSSETAHRIVEWLREHDCAI